MKAIQRVTTAACVLLTLMTGRGYAQQRADGFDAQMRKGDEAMQRREYDAAVQAYKKAYAISKKSSFDAAAAGVLAYRALGDHKAALDMAGEALKAAGQDTHLQAQGHNLRGTALYALSEKPLDELKGRTIVMDFWGSRCGPCRASTPTLITLQKKYAEQGVVFLGIARDKEKDFAEYVDKHHVGWPQFLDTSETIIHQFAIQGFPTFIVIDGEGVIRGRNMGWGPNIQSWLEDEIKKSLKKAQ